MCKFSLLKIEIVIFLWDFWSSIWWFKYWLCRVIGLIVFLFGLLIFKDDLISKKFRVINFVLVDLDKDKYRVRENKVIKMLIKF